MQGGDHSYFGSQVGMQQHIAVGVDGEGVAVGSELLIKKRKYVILTKQSDRSINQSPLFLKDALMPPKQHY